MNSLAHRDRGAGTGIYNPLTLRLYDLGVLGLSNALIWRCPTRTMVQTYRSTAGERHLDLGPGTGYYLTDLPRTREVTLLDLNVASLTAARQRIQHRVSVDELNQSIFDELPPRTWDSIAANFLLHCIPDPAKWDRLSTLHRHLNPGGRLFGATVILDHGAGWPARALNGFYNRVGVFGNRTDSLDDLHRALEHWDAVTITRCGQVALFAAQRPERTHPA